MAEAYREMRPQDLLQLFCYWNRRPIFTHMALTRRFPNAASDEQETAVQRMAANDVRVLSRRAVEYLQLAAEDRGLDSARIDRVDRLATDLMRHLDLRRHRQYWPTTNDLLSYEFPRDHRPTVAQADDFEAGIAEVERLWRKLELQIATDREPAESPDALKRERAALVRDVSEHQRIGREMASELSKADNREAAMRGGPGRRSQKEPPRRMIQAYQLSIAMPGTQADLAKALERELHRRVQQPDVSRWLKRVRRWLDAGNVLPDPSGERKEPAGPVDPAVIEMGQRRDGRTRRQRADADPDAGR